MSDEKKQKSRGLGDTVKKAIKVTTFGLVKQKPGCGCKGRQAWLNKKFPYKWFREATKSAAEMREKRAAYEQQQTKNEFQSVTEELLTPEQKKKRDELFAQRRARAEKPVSSPVEASGEEKKCLPCEKKRLEQERQDALRKQNTINRQQKEAAKRDSKES